jgi:hypothetical protein
MKHVLMVLSLLMVVFPVSAQRQSAGSETTVEIGAFTVALTDDWALADEDFEALYAVDEEFEPVVLAGTDGLEAILVDGAVFTDIAADATAEEALLAALLAVYEVEIEADDLETAEIDGVDAVFWSYEDADSVEDAVISGEVYWVTVDGASLFIDVYAEESVFADSAEAVDALLVGVQLGEAEDVETEAVACFVSTETARTATVRVGPGTNRTSLLFLNVGTDYPVTGRFVAENETVWYQLDKQVVDPNTSAAELWVAQSDVNETGDCDLVGEASAPPIRPIVPSAPADGSTVDGSTAQPGTVPQNGQWVITFADRGVASCIGTGSIDYEARQALGGQMSTPASPLTVAQGGASFDYDGFTFNLVSPGNYFGSININRSVFMIRVNVVNTGFMTGEAVIDVPTVFSRCSATIGITIARQ